MVPLLSASPASRVLGRWLGAPGGLPFSGHGTKPGGRLAVCSRDAGPWREGARMAALHHDLGGQAGGRKVLSGSLSTRGLRLHPQPLGASDLLPGPGRP